MKWIQNSWHLLKQINNFQLTINTDMTLSFTYASNKIQQDLMNILHSEDMHLPMNNIVKIFPQDWDHASVFLCKTPYSHGVSLYPCINIIRDIIA